MMIQSKDLNETSEEPSSPLEYDNAPQSSSEIYHLPEIDRRGADEQQGDRCRSVERGAGGGRKDEFHLPRTYAPPGSDQ